jgi:hypothetical protein
MSPDDAVQTTPARGAERDETPADRDDRLWNDRLWDDILQELRVVETGAQLIFGFG